MEVGRKVVRPRFRLWTTTTTTTLLMCAVAVVAAIKLNVPRVLLPYSQSVSANFTLEVTDGGCFSWYVTRPEVVKLHLMDDEHVRAGCSSKAVVTSSSRHSSTARQSTLVIIRNEATGETLHCDVTVANIHELEITTTTRELLLEDTPEAFTLRAKDMEGDTFSSIDGLVFEWSLVTNTGSGEVIDAYKVLRFMKFSESLYKASTAVYNLESQGLQGYAMLVQGIKTGTAIVRSTLKDAAYPESLSTEVTLTVVANLILWPPYEVYVLVGSIWSYAVHLIQHGKSLKISMPSAQYYLTLTDDTVATLNPETSEVEARSLGHTLLLLKDRNIKTKQAFRQPSVSIHVVAPHRVGLVIVPHQSWCLVADKEYTLAVRIFSVDNNELHITDNLRLVTKFSDEHFDVIYQSRNGSYVLVKTKKIGFTKCCASLDGVVQDEKENVLESSSFLDDTQDVEIVEQVRVEPNNVVLPWDPHKKPSYNVHLRAIGGGGYGFHWKSGNPSLCVCDQSGVVTTKSVGTVNITASSMCNLNNYGFATISVVSPDSIEVLTPATEVQLGSVVHVAVAVYTSVDKVVQSRIAISDCREYPFALDVTDSTRLEYLSDVDRSPLLKNACASLPFVANSIGLARLTVSLANEEASSRQASIVIIVYKPLAPISPENLEDSVLLAVGSSRRIVFEGGPKSWNHATHNYFRQLTIGDEATVSAVLVDPSELKNKDRHMFDVICIAIGQTSVILRVGNLNSSSNSKSSMAEASIQIICAYPAAMQLSPLVLRPEHHLSLCHPDGHTVAAHCYRDLDIIVVLLDKQQRPFYNFSSLELVWESSKPNIASFSSNVDVVSVDDFHDGYTTHNRSYRTLRPTNVEGLIHVTVSVRSYRREILTAASIVSRRLSTPEVTGKLFLDFVNDATFSEDTVTVFNHLSSKVSIPVSKGSGQFDYQPKDQPFARIHYDDKLQLFQIAPKSEGSFPLTLIDVCLESRSKAIVLVRVSGVKKVQVNVVDKVSLGEEITATVKILDQDGKVVPQSVFSMLHVQPNVASNILSLRTLPDSLLAIPEFQFRIKGDRLGHTTLGFTVSRKLSNDATKLDSSISSSQWPIQVFSPLRVHPRNITLIVGAVFQVWSSGGPHPQANVEFEMKDSDVASVSTGSGIVEGTRLGATVVFGRAVGSDPETGIRIVYSEDEVPVHVVSLAGIRIKSSLTRIQAGSTIPIYAVGIGDHEIPYAFGSAMPSLTFIWSTENKEVAVIQPLFHSCGIQLTDANHFMTRLVAKQPGQVTLSLKVYAGQKTLFKKSDGDFLQVQGNAVLGDALQIHVFDELRLVAPPFDPANIVVTPSTELKLITNKDRTSVVSHRIVDSSCSIVDGISVDANGLLRSGTRECRACLLVTSTDEIGLNQTISTLVMVKPISYMMVVSECSFQVQDRNLFVLPVGAESPFRVQFHDNVGNKFHLTNSKLKFRPSRFDLVRIEPGTKNDTFYIKAIGVGFTVVRVWDTLNPGIEDYFLVSSGEIIAPSRAVVLLGDRICFSCSVSTSKGSSGSWIIEDAGILQMDNVGLGIATNVGTSTITYNVSNEMATTTELMVAPIDHVEFDKTSSVKFVTNAHVDRTFRFPLLVRGGTNERNATPYNDVGSPLNSAGSNCTSSELKSLYSPVDCKVRFENDILEDSIVDVFDILQGFDASTGRHECRLQARHLPPSLARHWSSVTGNIELSATIRERSKQRHITSDKLRLPFLAAFLVLTPDVQVSAQQQFEPKAAIAHVSSGVVVVSAVDVVFQHLTVAANDSTLIDVLASESDAVNPHHRLFTVKMNSRFWKRWTEGAVLPAVHVHVYCSLTEQTVHVPVTFTLVGDKRGMCSEDEEESGWMHFFWTTADRYQSFVINMVVIIGTVVAIFFGYHATYGQRYYAALRQSDVYLNQSGMPLAGGRVYPSGTPGFSILASPNQTASCDPPHLWSVNEPVRGSPTFSRTPSPGFRTPDRYVMS